MCELLVVVMYGVNCVEVKLGDKVVVFGCGLIGFGMVLWLVDCGVIDVVVLDFVFECCEWVLVLGVCVVLDLIEVDFCVEFVWLYGEVLFYGWVGVGIDVYIDVVGVFLIFSDVIVMVKFYVCLVIIVVYMWLIEFLVGWMLISEMMIIIVVGYFIEMFEVVVVMLWFKKEIILMISYCLLFG